MQTVRDKFSYEDHAKRVQHKKARPEAMKGATSGTRKTRGRRKTR